MRTFVCMCIATFVLPVTAAELDHFARYGHWYFEDITRQLGPRSVRVSPKERKPKAVLAEMSRVSGGTTYLPEMESEPELAYICSQIALELRQQYTLAFYPTRLVTKGGTN